MAAEAKTPKEVIANYKRALIHAKGKQYAAETEVDYDNGWFRVRHVDGTESSYRRRQILFFTESLLEADFDREAYSCAVDERKAAKLQKAAQTEVQQQWAARPNPAFQTPTQNVWIGCFFSLTVLAISVGVIWWCVANWQEGRRKELAAQEAERRAEQDKPPVTSIEWSTVDSIYNLRSKQTDLQKDERWKQFKGQKVRWTGKVSSVGDSFGSLSVQIKMNPDTWTSDLLIILKDSQRSRATRLNKGDSVTFTGILDSWGTLLPFTLKEGEIAY